jgi:integrase
MSSIHRRPGSRIWRAFYRDQNGKQFCKSTGTSDKKAAHQIAQHYEAAAKQKRTWRQLSKVLAELHEALGGQKIPVVTLREFAKQWLESKELTLAQRSFAFYKSSVTKFLEQLGARADLALSELTKSDVLSYRAFLAKSLHPKTANHELQIVRMLFRSARRDELLAEDPAQYVESIRQKGITTIRRAFSVPEIQAVLSVCDPEWKTLTLCGLYTGQRLSDLALLRWSNIDLVNNQLRFVTAKTGRTMILPLAPPLRKHLEEKPSSDDPHSPLHPRAFAILARSAGPSTLSYQFGEILSQAGLRPKTEALSAGDNRTHTRRYREHALSFHCLRHTCVSLLHAAGLPQSVAMEFSGHASTKAHKLYTHTGNTPGLIYEEARRTGLLVYFDSDFHEPWRLLFFSSMANPRNLGWILTYLYEGDLIHGRKIGPRAIREATRKYYDEKIESYFRMGKFLHETFNERSSIFSLKELLETPKSGDDLNLGCSNGCTEEA